MNYYIIQAWSVFQLCSADAFWVSIICWLSFIAVLCKSLWVNPTVHCQQLLIVFYRCFYLIYFETSIYIMLIVQWMPLSCELYSSAMLAVYNHLFLLVVSGAWRGTLEDYQLVWKDVKCGFALKIVITLCVLYLHILAKL